MAITSARLRHDEQAPEAIAAAATGSHNGFVENARCIMQPSQMVHRNCSCQLGHRLADCKLQCLHTKADSTVTGLIRQMAIQYPNLVSDTGNEGMLWPAHGLHCIGLPRKFAYWDQRPTSSMKAAKGNRAFE